MDIIKYIDEVCGFFTRFEVKEIKPKRRGNTWEATVGSMTYHSRLDCTETEFIELLQYRVFNSLYHLLIQHQRSIIKEGDIVMEVGAYEGLYSLKLAELVGSSGQVNACELMPEHAGTLQFNFDQNQVNGTVFRCGVSADGGDVQVYSGRGQINGLREDVIGRYIRQEDLKKLTLPTQTLDQMFEQLQLTKPMKLLILMINGIEVDILKSFSYFEQVEHLYFAMKYTDLGEVHRTMHFLAQKGYRSEIHQSFMYAYRTHGKTKLLQQRVWCVTRANILHHPIEIIHPEVTRSLLLFLKVINRPSIYYKNISLELIVDLVRIGQEHYGERFPCLDDISEAVYPFEVIAIVMNQLNERDDLVMVFEPVDIDHIAYLLINLNRDGLKLHVKVDEQIKVNDHNSLMIFHPQVPR